MTLHGIAVTSSPITLTVSSTNAESKTIDVSVVAAVYYEKVVAASALKAGNEIIIGTTDGTSLLGKYVSGNNSPAVTNVPNASGKLIQSNLPNDYALLTLGGSSGSWSLTDQNSNIYFSASGDANTFKASSSATDTWSISITSAGVATITSATSSKSVKKNSNDPLFNCYASGQTDVSIYMIPSSDPELEVLVTGSLTLGVGETATLTATKLNGATGTVGWATSNSSILAISASTGDEITVTAGATLGNATITTSLSGCDDVVTAFTVRRGSFDAPYTVAQAITAIDSGNANNKTNVHTSGIISQVDTLNGDNSITYWISDNGTTTNQMEVFKGFGLSGATFTSADDLKVGDEVVVLGNLTKYSDTYEYAAGSQLVSFNRPSTELASITAIEGTLSANSGDASWDLSGLVVKGTMEGSASVVVVTMYVDLSTSDIPGTVGSTTTRDVVVTATGKDDSSITYTNEHVQGTITAYAGLIENGNYRIKASRVAGDVTTTYYLKENGSSSAPSAVTDFWEATVFTFTKIASNTYTISQGNSYLLDDGRYGDGNILALHEIRDGFRAENPCV